MEQRYENILLKAPLEYQYLFKKGFNINEQETLCKYDRETIIKNVVDFNINFCNKPAKNISHLLSPHNPLKFNLYNRLNKFYHKIAKKDVDYVVSFENTSLELLRLAYSIPYIKFNNRNTYRREYATIKLITQINERLMEYNISKKYSSNISMLSYINSASTYDILYFNKQNEYIFQFVQAISFFKLLEKEEKYTEILKAFNQKYNINNWRKYILTIVSLFGLSLKHNYIVPEDLHIDIDSLITKSILDEISIPYNIDYIPYSSKDEYDKKGNSDYRIFRNKPLFKLKNGDYIIHSIPLIIDRLYTGLYFDFRNISNNLQKKHIDVPNLFTSEFIEKTLFCGLMKKCINQKRYNALNEDDLKHIHKIKNDELGYPDYYVQSDNSVILFECKDIRLNAWIKEQRNYNLIEKELRNKLVEKTYKLDYNNKCHVNIKPRRIGCGQIAGHISNIRKGKFPWNKSIDKKIKIYPVLVISDNKLFANCLSSILQKWFKECLNKEGIDNNYENNLIILSPLTLLKYENLFKKDGFEKYFDEYYNLILQLPHNSITTLNRLISFDEYMEKYPYNLESLSTDMINELKK